MITIIITMTIMINEYKINENNNNIANYKK